MLFHVTFQIRQTQTVAIEAQDADEAKEIVLDGRDENVAGMDTPYEDIVVSRRVLSVSTSAPDDSDRDPEGLELYGDRPVEDGDDDDDDDRFDGNL
jgi:hypothetical protein